MLSVLLDTHSFRDRFNEEFDALYKIYVILFCAPQRRKHLGEG